MKQNALTTAVKIFVVAISAMILTLAAFGIGVSVGASQMRQAAALPSPATAEPVDSDTATGEAPAAVTPRTPSDTMPKLDSKLFNEAMGLLEDQFYGDLPEGEDLTYNAIQGVVKALDDPHTAFLDPQQAAMFNTDIEGTFEGIGAQVDKEDGGGVEIKYLFAEQPAIKAGLKVGDFIMAVDGKDVTGLDINAAVSLIRGPRDTQVTLTIQRGAGEPLDVVITRASIEIPVVESKTLGDGKVEYIALAEFSSVAPERLANAVKEALAKKPTGLILDLRGNPGGLLDAAVRIGSYFVPEGNIVIERFKDGRQQEYGREGRYLLGKIPLVVLVDAGSASASEIVAGAIQDAGTGVLIGETTYGKGSVQLPNALSDGSQLRVTIAHWFTPKDRGIHGTGLEPDIAVPVTEEDITAERDPQLDRAVEYLLTGK